MNTGATNTEESGKELGPSHGPWIRIGVDTGGTFTDVVAVDTRANRIVTTKTPSTPGDPAEGFLTGIRKILALIGADRAVGAGGADDAGGADSADGADGADGAAGSESAGAGPGDVAAILHGTTVATNQLLQGSVGRLGLITTEGYEFILEIARQSVPDGYGNSYFWVKPDRIVPADLVRTVGGRMDFRGTEIRPLDEDSAIRAVEFFRAQGVSTIGVCLLHSYANDAHERRLREILLAEYPDAVVSLSCEVLPEYREYERAMTTLVDAAVKPTVGSYVSSISRRLAELAPDREIPFSIMRSNGGVLSAHEVVHKPITTVLSGPAAGALGAALIAGRAGFSSVVTCDGGGTSTDVSVIHDGAPSLTTEGAVGPFPARIPMIDVVTVGAGGGSIAWVSPEDALKVGPRSAGADPGPLCYGKSGTEVTVTDAHLVLGRVPPRLLGGEIALDLGRAEAGLRALADRIGLGLEACAAGVLEISAWNQANALRQVTVRRGLDIRDYPMVTFGGSGSLLACRLMDILGLPTVLVPPNPGTVSAFGLLTVDVRDDYVRTSVGRHDSLNLAAVATIFGALTDRAREALLVEGFRSEEQVFERTVDLRYLGQAYEVPVACPPGEISAYWADRIADEFHEAHRALYGYDFRGNPAQQVEWVNMRVTGIGPIPRPAIPEIEPSTGGADAALAEVRPVFFESWCESGVYDRSMLGSGDVVVGPAVVEEFGSTVPVHPGFIGTVDRFGNLLISRSSAVVL